LCQGSPLESFSQNKVKKIISCDPRCATMLDNDYRQIGAYAAGEISVVHHSVLISGSELRRKNLVLIWVNREYSMYF
jgi:Fe-S oxidoreductase